MKQRKTKPFPYYVGLHSLEELVTKDSRVCVINILGNESRMVTPVSHAYSGANVVAGVQYGRQGVLETPVGDIPVYRSLRDVMDAGHTFDTGVIYLPPAAVSQSVWELASFNKDLKRIVIVTENVPQHVDYPCGLRVGRGVKDGPIGQIVGQPRLPVLHPYLVHLLQRIFIALLQPGVTKIQHTPLERSGA